MSYLYDRGLINGISATEFVPQREVTRAEFIKMLGAAAEISNQNSKNITIFKDVKEDDWYAPYVQWGNDNGITNGKAPDLFYPNDNLTKEEAAVMVYRFANTFIDEEWQEKPTTSSALLFSDSDNISSWAKDAVYTLGENDVLKGDKGSFNPQKNILRSRSIPNA